MKNQPIQTEKSSHLESTPPPPSQPPITQPRKPKALIIIFALITLASLATAAYFFSQNQQLKADNSLFKSTNPSLTIPAPSPENSAANWVEYRNEDFGFVLKYPSQKNEITNTSDSPCDLTQYPQLSDDKQSVVILPGEPCSPYFAVSLIDSEVNEPVKSVWLKHQFNQDASGIRCAEYGSFEICTHSYTADGQKFSDHYEIGNTRIGLIEGLKVDPKYVNYKAGWEEIYIRQNTNQVITILYDMSPLSQEILSTFRFND